MADPIADLVNALQSHPDFSKVDPTVRRQLNEELTKRGYGHMILTPPSSDDFISRVKSALVPDFSSILKSITTPPQNTPEAIANLSGPLGVFGERMAAGLVNQMAHGAPIDTNETVNPTPFASALTHLPFVGQQLGQTAQDIKEGRPGAIAGDLTAAALQIFGPKGLRMAGESFGPALGEKLYGRTIPIPTRSMEGKQIPAMTAQERLDLVKKLFQERFTRQQETPGYMTPENTGKLDKLINVFRKDADAARLASSEEFIPTSRIIQDEQAAIANVETQFPEVAAQRREQLAKWVETKSGIEREKFEGDANAPATLEPAGDYIDRVTAAGHGQSYSAWQADKEALRSFVKSSGLEKSSAEIAQGAPGASRETLANNLQKAIDSAQQEIAPNVKLSSEAAHNLILLKRSLVNAAVTQPREVLKILPLALGVPVSALIGQMGFHLGNINSAEIGAVGAAGITLYAFRTAFRNPAVLERLAFALNNLGKGPASVTVGNLPRISLLPTLPIGAPPTKQGK